MAKAKDENYYKKLYKKIKQNQGVGQEQLFRELFLLKSLVKLICAREKDGRVVITKDEIAKLKPNLVLGQSFPDTGDVVFYVVEKTEEQPEAPVTPTPPKKSK